MSDENTSEVVKITTALKILMLLDERAPVPLATHGIGLQIQDPTNSLSVIMKTLARDGYIHRVGDNGKRTGLWELTEIGKRSILRRAAASDAARAWLRQNPGLDQVERTVLLTLQNEQGASPAQISDATGLRVSAVRQALRDLAFRSLVEVDQNTEVASLSANGDKVLRQLHNPQTEREVKRENSEMTGNTTHQTGYPSTAGNTSEISPEAIRKAVIDKLDEAESVLKAAENYALHAQQKVQYATSYRNGLRDALQTLDIVIADLSPKSPPSTVAFGQAIPAVTVPATSAPLQEPLDVSQRPAESGQPATVQPTAGEVVAPAKRGRGRPRRSPVIQKAREVASRANSFPIAAAQPSLAANETDRLHPEIKAKAQVASRMTSSAQADEATKAGSGRAGTMKKAILQVVRDGGEAGLSRPRIFEAVEKIYNGQLKAASLRTTLFDLGKKGFIKNDAGNWTVSNRALVDASISD
jgi:DNA-binding IclR family transcriptional regulator